LRRQAEAVPAVAQQLQPLFADLQRLVPIPNAQGYRNAAVTATDGLPAISIADPWRTGLPMGDAWDP
jgi:hypothetical protein